MNFGVHCPASSNTFCVIVFSPELICRHCSSVSWKRFNTVSIALNRRPRVASSIAARGSCRSSSLICRASVFRRFGAGFRFLALILESKRENHAKSPLFLGLFDGWRGDRRPVAQGDYILDDAVRDLVGVTLALFGWLNHAASLPRRGCRAEKKIESSPLPRRGTR